MIACTSYIALDAAGIAGGGGELAQRGRRDVVLERHVADRRGAALVELHANRLDRSWRTARCGGGAGAARPRHAGAISSTRADHRSTTAGARINRQYRLTAGGKLTPHQGTRMARILVIDDDPGVRESMARMLRGAGYTVQSPRERRGRRSISRAATPST